MFKIDENYSDYYGIDLTKYPGGMAVNSSGVDSTDGTPWLAKMFNNCIGWMQAVYIRAFGSLAGISNDAENVQTSDILRSLEKMRTDNNAAERQTSDGKYFPKEGGTVTGDLSVTGGTQLKETVINGDLQVSGNITESGEAYETHAQQIYTKSDLIVARDGAVSALSSEEYSGILVQKADGTNDVAIAVDSDGNARVGNYQLVIVYSEDGTHFFSDPELSNTVTIPIGITPRPLAGVENRYYYAGMNDTQPIATRNDETNMAAGKLVKWNASQKRIETTPYSDTDIGNLQTAVQEIEAQGNLDSHGGILAPVSRWLRFSTEDKKSLVIKANTIIKVGNHIYMTIEDTTFDLSPYLTTAGKDYFVFLNWAESGGEELWTLTASQTKAEDSGTSRCIGRLHTLCVAVPSGTMMTAPAAPSSGIVIGDSFLIKPYREETDADFFGFYSKTVSSISQGTYYDVITCEHPLAGFLAGDILPESVFSLTWHPDTLIDDGMVYEKETDTMIDIYLQSGRGSSTRSLFGAATTRIRPQICHQADMHAVGKMLLSDDEFSAAALGSNEKTAIAGTSEQSIQTAGGHNDTASRRMISAIGCEDMCGGVWQWLRDVSGLGSGTGWTNINGQGGYVGNTGWITEDGQNQFGQMYNCVVALLAGGNWRDGSFCGSRSRTGANARSTVSAHCGARGSSRVVRGL